MNILIIIFALIVLSFFVRTIFALVYSTSEEYKIQRRLDEWIK